MKVEINLDEIEHKIQSLEVQLTSESPISPLKH